MRDAPITGSAILALQRAAHIASRTVGAVLARRAGLGLLPSEVNALANLAGGPMQVGALAVATGARPTTLTSVLDRLTARGLIAREVDPADRRSFLVSLTPGGQEAAQAISAVIEDAERTALGGVTAADLAGFRAVIRALTDGHDEQGGTT